MIQRTIRGPPNAQTGSTSNQLTPKAPYKPAPAKAGGRCMDNIFVERLWRSLKYEEVYLRAYATVAEAKAGIGAWISFYNDERQHQSLGYRRPRQGYEESLWIRGRLALPTA